MVAQVQQEPAPAFDSDIDPGTKSELVKKLQKTLKNLGYFNGVVTTEYFGETTRKAVLAFQIDKGIISSENDIGAGRVGPSTRNALNELL